LFFLSFFITIRILFDIYAILIFTKVILIYLFVFNIIDSQNLILFIPYYVSSNMIDPFVHLILYFIPWLENYFIAFTAFIFFFLSMYKFIFLLGATKDEALF
jgi:hypothetical protein